ncbi:MAG: hypothetical protein VX498_11750, partial [Myxococcota bacterium]|nr:hypothetical protein [Myxococcota bacterium]
MKRIARLGPSVEDEPKSGQSRPAIWAEVLLLYLGSCALIRVIKSLVDTGTLSNDWLVLVALVFLYMPLLAEKKNGYRVDGDILFPDPFWPAMKKALLFFGVVTGLIYLIFIPSYHFCQGTLYHWFSTEALGMACTYPGHPHYDATAEGMRAYGAFKPRNAITGGILVTIGMQALYQLLCVGYAEEFFYRGYMQT